MLLVKLMFNLQRHNQSLFTMKKSIFVIAITLFCFVLSCKNDKNEKTVDHTITPDTKELVIVLEPKNESNVTGKVVFVEHKGNVSIKAMFKGLSEGTHAIHIHEKADCSSADGKSTGGHWNPTGQPHGKWGDAEGYHKGDIGNFDADANGNASLSFSTNEWCIGCDDEKKNVIGKAIIVHQGIDDFTSQPSGAAGSRISCGAIIE